MIFLRPFLFLLVLLPLQIHAMEVRVAHVIDGDTFVTTGGDHVRLVGINTPERGKADRPDEPFYKEAKIALSDLIEGKDVTLSFGKKKKDKYKRLLAQVHLKSNAWVNKSMVEKGLAHVYSFPDTSGAHIYKLIAAEDNARTKGKGLWSLPRWSIKNANNIKDFTPNDVGEFHIFTGKVSTIADVKKRLYLNFGKDWRTDVTAEIPPKYRNAFPDKSTYMGKRVRVRGIIKPVNGYMVTLTHSEQIEILN